MVLLQYIYDLGRRSKVAMPDLDCTTEGATQTDRAGEQRSDDRVVAGECLHPNLKVTGYPPAEGLECPDCGMIQV